MADQATKSIRRIVQGLKADPDGLGLADDYKGLGTSRGEAFINARGDVTGSGATGSGDDKNEQPSSGTPSTGNPDDNDTGGGGGVNSGSDPADALAGDVDDVDGATTTDSQIGTVTGTVSGTLTSLNLNTLEGIEYIPPDGWDTPCLSDGALSFQEGTYLEFSPLGGIFQTQLQAKENLAARFENDVEDWSFGSKETAPGTLDSWTVDFQGTPEVGGFMNRFSCATRFRAVCDLAPPAPDDQCDVQPSSGVCEVVYDAGAGGYKGNANDPDCDAAQILPTDFVIIRSVSDTNKYFRYTKLANGGTKITQVDAGGVPVPGTITKTTDEGGRVDGFFDVALDAGIT